MEREECYGTNREYEKRRHSNDQIQVNPIQTVLFEAFPKIEAVFKEKQNEGYKLCSIQYETRNDASHESLIIVLSKGYEHFLLEQSKGNYAGGYSHAIFRREGEQGEIL
ncbi:hypothetical protein [Paenibacillus sp. IITD108]|uniref:hypothetical protein n=1 Tax=Paenibacillus sp. IITD108 TaxID=3116649 RepID=UPI002F41E4D9